MAQQAAAPAIVSLWSSKSTVPRVIAEGDRLRHTKFVARRDDKDLREGVQAQHHERNLGAGRDRVTGFGHPWVTCEMLKTRNV